jgi:arylformamidase
MIYDITPPVTPNLAVWPGDTHFNIIPKASFRKGDPYLLSTIESSLHIGAHVDAPLHAIEGGTPVDQLSFEHFLGPCQVITVDLNPGEEIYLHHLKTRIFESRVLFRTNSYHDLNRFSNDFNGISIDLAEELFIQGVITVGIDTPSIEVYNSEDLVVHKALFKRDMAIMEGLMLRHVPDGIYELIALPLRLTGLEASPVRAILRKIDKKNSPEDNVLRQARPLSRPTRRPLTPLR